MDNALYAESALYAKSARVLSIVLIEVLPELILEVRCEDTLAQVFLDFQKTPKAATRQFFLARMDFAIIHAAVDIDEFFLPLAFEHIMTHRDGLEIGDTQLFPHLTVQSLLDTFAEVHMSSTGRVPFVRLYVLPLWSMLQVEFAFIIKKV